MGQTIHCIDGNFLPPIQTRLKRAVITAFDGHAENPYKNYQDPDVKEYTTTTTEGIQYKFSVCDPNPYARKSDHNSGEVLYILGGLRSMAHDKKDLYDRAKTLGIPVVFGQLPNADDLGSTEELLPTIDIMSRHFLKNLPMMERYQNKRANLFGTSTGGYEITDYLHSNADDAAELLRTFHCTKLFSAFFLAAFANGPISKHVYPHHAGMQAKNKYGQCKLDRDHMLIKELVGDPVYLDPDNNGYPPHAEILYMADIINARREKLLASPFPRIVRKAAEHGGVEFLHGSRDGVADMTAAMQMADHMGADFVKVLKTYHNIYTHERISAILHHFSSSIKRPLPERHRSIVRRPFEFAGKPLSSLPSIMHRTSVKTPSPKQVKNFENQLRIT